MILLDAKNVVKQYAGHLALDDVSIRIPRNSIYGLLGPNGAGKTTFIRIINGITKPDSGIVFLKGRQMQLDDVRNIGYLPEERGLYQKMKAGKQVLYLARLKGLSKEDALKRAKLWFDRFGMLPWWNNPIESLSKGMQQKIQFIATVLHEPELLIFDEPFSGFDPLNTNMLKQEILQLRDKGATIIFSTHNMLSVEELCDHISLLNQSKVVLEGTLNDIRTKFKQPIFVVKTEEDNVDIPENNIFQIIAQERKKGITEIKIKTKTTISNNDLIREILPYCSILSFEEELPSMNDAFIKTVGNQTNPA